MLHASIAKKVQSIEDREERLLDALADGSLPTAKIRSRLAKVTQERDRVLQEKRETDEQLAIGAEALKTALAMVVAPQEMYLHSPDRVRRTMNEALLEKLYLDERGSITETHLQPAFHQLVTAYPAYRATRTTPKSRSQRPSNTNEKSHDRPVVALARLDAPSTETEAPFGIHALLEGAVSNTDNLVPPTGFEPALPP